MPAASGAWAARAYETCKTYLQTQGRFLLILWVFIGIAVAVYFGKLATTVDPATGAEVHGFPIGRVAIIQRDNASRSPRAMMRTPITMDDYLESRMIVEPLCLFDCCLETDAAIAVVVTSAERARDLRHRPVLISGAVWGGGHTLFSNHRDDLTLTAAVDASARLYEMAGVGPSDISYANLHGTSTQLNDRIETRALKLALGEDRARQVPMSALKSQIGHPQGACGAAGVTATLIAMHHGQIPPTLNLTNPSAECDLDYVPDVGRKKAIEHAVCNCIAFGSKNSALVLRMMA